MRQSKIKKPTSDIDLVSKLFFEHGKTITLSVKNDVKFDIGIIENPSVMLIESGQVFLHRKLDDKIILEFATSLPFGIMNSCSMLNNFYLSCKTNSFIKILDRDLFLKEVSNKGLLLRMLNVISYLIDVITEKQHKTITVDNNYNVIKSCIEEIWNLTEDERSNTSLYKYILSRNHISKSSITKILKYLNDFGYIETKRARLMNYKHLPDKY